MKARVLVCGGAGYIGSHMVRALVENGANVLVIDDLSRGHEEAVWPGAQLVVGSIGDGPAVRAAIDEFQPEAVMHFCAFALVGESVRDPAAYWQNNVVHGLALLDALTRAAPPAFIFSSSAATFGDPVRMPMDEAHPQVPVNPYGWTKLAFEQILAEYDRAYGLRSVSLRYFNAAGAWPDGSLGEDHDPESHLIPLALRAVQRSGGGGELSVFGTDYPTPDGTCIRDYIHILDLVQAHDLALRYLLDGGETTAFNLGNGEGYSVLDVIRACESATRCPVPWRAAPRRAGDPPALVADAEKARRVLRWSPRYPELERIVETAWTWHRTHPRGYAG